MFDFEILMDWLRANPGWISLAIFLIAFVESLAIAGVIVPGVVMLFMASALAGSGALSLYEALIWAFWGAVAGDGLSFFIGHTCKHRIPHLWPVRNYPSLLASGEAFFRKHGGKSILIGRFIGPLRPILPLVAGMLHMPVKRFVGFNLLSALGWAPLYVLPGFLVGASITLEVPLPEHFFPVLAISLAILSGLFFLMVRLHWAINPGGVLYRKTHSWLVRYNAGHRFWRALATPMQPQKLTDAAMLPAKTGGEFPLSSLLLTLTSGLSFLLLALIVTHTPWLRPLDLAVVNFFQVLRAPLFEPFMLVLTLIGDDRYLFWIMPLFIGLLAFRGFYAAAVHVALAGICIALLTHGFKAGFAIPRPDLALFPPKSFSFPSGHGSGSMVFWGLLGAFMAREVALRQRWLVYLACALPVLLVCISRLYLGVHWFSDVAGGVLLGLFICGLTRTLYSRFDRQCLTVDTSSAVALVLWLALSFIYVHRYYDAAQRAYQPKVNVTATMAMEIRPFLPAAMTNPG